MIRKKPRADAHRVLLSTEEREGLVQLTSSGQSPAREQKRARVLLLLAEGWAPSDVPAAVGCGEATVRRTRQKYEAGGVDWALHEPARPGGKRLLTSKQEAQIVAMVCAAAPAGRARWTVRLIAEEAVQRGIVRAMGRETARVLLRDHELRPWREKNVVRRRAR